MRWNVTKFPNTNMHNQNQHKEYLLLSIFCSFLLQLGPLKAEVDPLALLNIATKSGQDTDNAILHSQKQYASFHPLLQQMAKDTELLKSFVKQSVELLETQKGQNISWKGMPAKLISLDGTVVELKSQTETKKDNVSSLRAAHHLQLRGLNKQNAEVANLRDCGLLAFCHGQYSSARGFLTEVVLSHPVEDYFEFMNLEFESKALARINEIKSLDKEKKLVSTRKAIKAFRKAYAQTKIADLHAEYLFDLQHKIDARSSAISKEIAKLDSEIEKVYNLLVTAATKDYMTQKKDLMAAFDTHMKTNSYFVAEKRETRNNNKKGGNKNNNNKKKTRAEDPNEPVLAHASILPAVFAAPATTPKKGKATTKKKGKGNNTKKQEDVYNLKKVKGEKTKKQVLASLQKIYQDHKEGDKKLSKKSYETIKKEIARLGNEISTTTAQAKAKGRSITSKYNSSKARLLSRKLALRRRVRKGARPNRKNIQSYFETGKMG